MAGVWNSPRGMGVLPERVTEERYLVDLAPPPAGPAEPTEEEAGLQDGWKPCSLLWGVMAHVDLGPFSCGGQALLALCRGLCWGLGEDEGGGLWLVPSAPPAVLAVC